MLRRPITYTDFNGNEVTETFRFNLTEAELVDKQLTTKGGYAETIKAVIDAEDSQTLMEIFKELILSSIGEISLDGKKFMKSEEIKNDFKCSAAYSALYMELITNENAGVEFVNGILPEKFRKAIDNAKEEKRIADIVKSTGPITPNQN